jgi:hypothetical protein
MAHNGNAFGSLAMIKQKIMLHGGVITAMAKLPAFESYPGTPPQTLYDEEVPANENVELHAVFCYGFADSATTPGAGYWLCKNRQAAVAVAAKSVCLQEAYNSGPL